MSKPMMVVVNPCSANGKTGKHWTDLNKALDEAGVNYDFTFTGGPKEATAITRKALKEGHDTIVSIGGDGTLNEVINGFFEDGQLINPEARLGVISCGTGGDFVKTAGIPKEHTKAAEILARGQSKPIDIGRVIYTNHQGQQESMYYINVVGLGIDGEIVERVNRTTKAFGGFLSFFWGTITTLASYQNRRVTIEIDGMVRYQGPILFAAVANGQWFGGGMHVAPNARLDSGQFEVVIIKGHSKLRTIGNMPKLYKGTHVEIPEVICLRGNNVRAFSEERVLLDIDGEQPGRLNVELVLVPNALRLIC
ncbi:MAG: diacylglycerol/lipid kinase family protein [Candidatus Saccharibacteria bacterium]